MLHVRSMDWLCVMARWLESALQLFADPDAPIFLVGSAHGEPSRKIHAEKPKMIRRRAVRAGSWIGLRELETLALEVLACRVEQRCCNALAPNAWCDDETQDRSDLLRMWNRLCVEHVKQFAGCRIAPAHHLASPIGKEPLHFTPKDASVRACAVYSGRSTGPMDLRMIFVEALAVAR